MTSYPTQAHRMEHADNVPQKDKGFVQIKFILIQTLFKIND
jgi:hypothetical protein